RRVSAPRDRFAGRAIEREPALDLAARRDLALDRDAPAVRIDQEERDLPIGPGRDDRARRQVRRRDAGLDAVEGPGAPAAAPGRGGRRGGVRAGPHQRARQDRLAPPDRGAATAAPPPPPPAPPPQARPD